MQRNIINLLALTLITLILWVTFQLFQITTRSGIPEATQKQLESLDPSLDFELIDELNDPNKTLR